MEQIESKIDVNSPEFQANAETSVKAVELLRERLNEMGKGGPEKYRERHKSRGKLLPRERIERLFDPDTPFLELSPGLSSNHLESDQ